jgi:hypothetical protein
VCLFSICKGENAVEGEQVARHGGDITNTTMQLLGIPNSQFQKCFGKWKAAGTSVWCLKGTTLKGISTVTPQVS